IILIDEKMDHGPILAQKEIPISPEETTLTLTAKLAYFGGDLLVETIQSWLKDGITPQPQDHEKTTYTKLIKKKDGHVDWDRMGNENIERMIRAYQPWPGVWTTVGEMADQLEQELRNKKHKSLKLKILTAHLENGVLALDRVQVEGKKPISLIDFGKGYLK
ncbi:MAG: hypothetical protein K940chlam2_01810, partial [Chlamydiae bacterium]|nr:hypothetical protein [Chlamydiota bacterium]